VEEPAAVAAAALAAAEDKHNRKKARAAKKLQKRKQKAARKLHNGKVNGIVSDDHAVCVHTHARTCHAAQPFDPLCIYLDRRCAVYDRT
jgi:hypothetical protein